MNFILSLPLRLLSSVLDLVATRSRQPMPRARTVSELRAQLRRLDFALIYQERVSPDDASDPRLIMLFWRSSDGLFVHLSTIGDSIGAANLHFCWRGNSMAARRALPELDCGRNFADGDTWYASGSYRLDSSSANGLSLEEFIFALQKNGTLLKVWKVPHFFWITRDGRQNCANEIIGKLGRGTQRALRGNLLPQFQGLLPNGEMI